MQCDRKTIISLTLISYQEKVLISHMWPPTQNTKDISSEILLIYSLEKKIFLAFIFTLFGCCWFDSYQLNSCRRLWPQTGINAPIIHPRLDPPYQKSCGR